MNPDRDTIAALATPVGTSAVAVVRASGPACRDLAAQLARQSVVPRRAVYCDYLGCGGALVDDVLLTYFQGPHSYTGEDSLEISCHGNPFIAQRIVEDLLARGCRSAQAGEFTQRAFLNGRLDLSQAEAVMDVIRARSERALNSAQRQLRGALGARMEAMIERLVSLLARVEAYIDFPEEDLPPEDRGWLEGEIERLGSETRQLRATSRYGDILRDGLKTVIVGRTNAGKSSLLNRLVGSERAIVSAEPGTTRDFIEECIVVGPHCLRLIDTAGFNTEATGVERLGIERTRKLAERADLVLRVIDITRWEDVAGDLAEYADEPATMIVVCNKADLATPLQRQGAVAAGACVVSAATGEGLDDLSGAIARFADGFKPRDNEDEIAINARHAEALARAQEGLAAAGDKLRSGVAVELVASDLREVLAAYGDIGGRIDNERVLDSLFASFCIGK
ncbi:tRNA uridine-5-carboxymethylaminomethyl(34) synthesis GTPase MnmE [Horticoccus luteus]|uniref:tRNA modification GTPase MnmE n=1 Tax=Horticoccus luteus TaxID=2862869 RepID=A0A8F9TX73_9BACT|nr:tRNA uridine-5-carboxymethylaminomethyl(34) synthesis GTPase MnmE [Horticoccus luteus]QYM80864.1 tRNA uridine-5-carboxymethylaminomethyl(34) synthesis GTPase MnmE [Horticoccus luteus]